VSTPSSTSASPSSTTTSTAPVVPSQPGAGVGDDLAPAVGDFVVDDDGAGVPVPFPDPDADGDDPDEVEPRDESTSGPNDRG
jgi:hypothetical protein